jgi:hypothetical protein
LGVTTRWEGDSLRILVPGADRLEFYPLSPGRGMDRAVETGASEGESLTLRWSERAMSEVSRVRGVLLIEERRSRRIVEIEARPPRS